MDVSFSAWRHSREESLQLKGESFSFLFDRRYTNRLNRMSRVFFEAYVVATKELAAQEDRFPSLSEIDAKMESGAVYAFKDRLMKNTEFFEEVKISGVSYLVPRALKFIDVTGTYTDLILNLEEGAVVMPTRRKTPSLPESPCQDRKRQRRQGTLLWRCGKKAPTPAQKRPDQVEKDKESPTYPQHVPEAFEEIDETFGEQAETVPLPERHATKTEQIAPSREETEPKKPSHRTKKWGCSP